MSKLKNQRAASKAAGKSTFLNSFDFEKLLPRKYQIPAIIAFMIVLFLIFLKPLYFDNMTFESADIIASRSAIPYVEKPHEGFTLWNPHIFCGMPSYSIAVGFTWFNLIYVISTEARNLYMVFFSNDYVKWTYYLILFAITMFFLMKHLTKNLLVSLFSSVSMVFSTGIIVFLYIGHVTKLTSLCMFPLIFLMLLRMQKKITLLDFTILAIALQMLIQGFHVQIIFYLLLAVGLYYIYYLIHSLKKKDSLLRNNLLKSAGALAIAIVIGMAIQSDNFTQIYEYTPYSTRGTKSVTELSAGTTEKSQSDYYKYHTDWSFSPGEVMTFIVPSFYGFGRAKDLIEVTGQAEPNTYFGQMPFVDVAMYMGVVVFFLALFAMITQFREPIVRYFTILVIFSLLLSFGRTFPLLFDPFFNYFPYFDKFRVPSMILVLVQFSMPVLAGLGLEKIIKLNSENDKLAVDVLKYGSIVLSALFLLSLVLNQALGSWIAGRMLESANAQSLTGVSEFIANMFSNDVLINMLFVSVVFGLGFAVYLKKVSPDIFIIAAVVLTLADLWRVDNRAAIYKEAPEKVISAPDYVRAIKELNEKEPFRILNLKQDNSKGSVGQNSNYNMYFLLEDFDGYSAVKPRAMQDVRENVGYGNLTLWRMANVKYIILDKQYAVPNLELLKVAGTSYIYKNQSALRRYYFVNSVQQKTGMEVIEGLKNNSFDPGETAFTEESAPKVDRTDSTASIKLLKYTDEVSQLDVNASGDNFMVFATTYHPKGWQALIDGKETKLYRANHMFMGIVVPKGKHTVEFRYAPKSFFIAKNVSLVLSSLLLIGFGFGLYFQRKQKAGEVK